MHLRYLLLTAFALASHANAQCSTFANAVPGTDLHLGDDDVRTVGLGFAFPFRGQVYHTISVAANGFVWLGTVTPADHLFVASDYADNEPDLLAWEPRIAVCWNDWNPASSQLAPGGGVFVRGDSTTAAIVWKGIPEFSPGASSTAFANMELVLTAGGVMALHYDASMGIANDDSIVGISAGLGATANAISWASSLPSTISTGTAYELVAAGTFGLAGLTIQLTPLQATADNHAAVISTMSTCPPATPVPLASTPVAYGAGCPALAGTNVSAVYELFTPDGGTNPTDLSGHSVTFLRSGSTYIAIPGPGFDTSYQTHGRMLPLEDESVATNLSVGPMGSFPFSSLQVATVEAASNGYLTLQPGGASQWLPGAADLLAGAARIAPHWSDYDLYFQGTFYWSNDDPSFCMATWENVEAFTDPGSSNTFQVKLMANGDITFAYGLVHSQFDNVLVGFSLGNGGTDPGPIDFSSAPNNTLVRDIGSLVLPLRHTTSGPASINTPFSLLATDLPAGTLIGAFALGAAPQNLDLSTLGMPGCAALVTLDELFVTVAANATLRQTFAIPATPTLFGVTAHSQAAALAPANAFGMVTSNAVTFTIGR